MVATPFTIMVGNGLKRSPAAAALSTHCSVPMKFITASGATADRNGSTSGSPSSTAPSDGLRQVEAEARGGGRERVGAASSPWPTRARCPRRPPRARLAG